MQGKSRHVLCICPKWTLGQGQRDKIKRQHIAIPHVALYLIGIFLHKADVVTIKIKQLKNQNKATSAVKAFGASAR